MTKKSVFKRILKVVGFVILGVVLVVGGMIGVMTIRGDFKTKKIEPTEISFQIDGVQVQNVKLNYNIADTAEDRNIYSFTIKALPEDVTELECALKVSEPIISFKKKENGKWVDYDSNIFYLNRPIYFTLKNITEENENLYNDGIITIDVETGFLKQSITLEIDRTVTSVSLVDKGNAENNKITNGLFEYEYDLDDANNPVPKYNGANNQLLELVMNQDYPFEVITAPLKALKPFNSTDAKIIRIYLVENNQLKLLTHEGEQVKLQVFNDAGEVSFEDCSFIRFDTEKGVYVFNSSNTGNYEFKLAVYKTYADQERIEQDTTMSIDDKLAEMLTKTVILTVTGTDAQYIKFNEASNINLELLEDNKFVLNDSSVKNATNLGLAITKNKGVEITGRYNELSFIDENSFSNALTWNFNIMTAKEDGGYEKSTEKIITIKFNNDTQGKKYAQVFDLPGIPSGTRFSVELVYDVSVSNYVLTLTSDTAEYELSIALTVDSTSNKVLSPKTNEFGVVEIKNGDSESSGIWCYAQFAGGNTMILGSDVDGKYNFKTLKQGLYLVFLGRSGSDTVLRNINDKFKFGITRKNGADNEINIIPIDSGLKNLEKYLYAIIVNADGTLAYTDGGDYSSESCTVNVSSTITEIELEKAKVFMPVTIGDDGFNYGNEIPTSSLVKSVSGSFKGVGVLLFAPKFELLTNQPDNWESNFSSYYKFEAGTGYTRLTELPESVDWSNSIYYTKNNYEFIDGVSYKNGDIIYYLLGYIGNSGKFVNSVKATGENYGSKLYPLVPQTNYLVDYNRNQTVEEYVDYILANAISADISANVNENSKQVNYDTSLSLGKKVYLIDGYVQAPDSYSKTEKYYKTDSMGNYVSTKPSQDDINDWTVRYIDYYVVAPRYVNIDKYVSGVSYYKLEAGSYTECTSEANSNSSKWEEFKTTYFVKEDGYIIKSVKNDGFNPIEITATLCSDGIEIAENKIIVKIEQNAHETNAISSLISQNNFGNKAVEIESYYDFSKSTVKPNAQFTGNYYDIAENYDDNKFYIIAGHKNINNKNWKGETVEEDSSISKYEAEISLGIDSKDFKEILGNISNLLELKAYEYNSMNQLVKTNCEAISFGSKNQEEVYVKASNKFDENSLYFIKIENRYETADISQDIKDDWANKYSGYYVKVTTITAQFIATDTLESGNYVRLTWVYTGGGIEYTIQSDKLYIQSRQVSEYKVDIGTTAYQAIKLTADSYSGDFYELNENNQYVLVADKSEYQANKYYKLQDYIYTLETAETIENWETEYSKYYTKDGETYTPAEADSSYEKNKYYTRTLDYIKYNAEIEYKIIVCWDSENDKYSYIVYAVDANGNNLFTEEGGELVSISTDIEKAFNFNGWIKSNPFYATNTEYNISCDNFKDNYEDSKHSLEVKLLPNINPVDVALRNTTTSSVGLTIRAWIVQQGFEFKEFEEQQSAEKEIKISTGHFKNNDTNLDGKLVADISNIVITRSNLDVTGNYDRKDEAGAIKYINKNDESDYVEVVYDGQWVVRRSQFVNVEMTIQFGCIMGSKECKISFTNPYNILRSNTNNTEYIYSGTTFTLAKVGLEIGNIDEDVLYKLATSNASATFAINVYETNTNSEFATDTFYSYQNGKYVLLSSKPSDWETNYSNYYKRLGELTAVENSINYTILDVTVKTTIYFELCYNYGEGINSVSVIVDTFVLTAMPNAVITGDVSKTIKIDDYNTTYDVSELKIKKFKIKDGENDKKYLKYELDDNNLEDITGEMAFQFETFTDSEFGNKYSTNVVEYDIANKLVKASIIGEKGTYYVKADVLIGGAVIGNLEFEVTSKSDITGENGQVKDLTITAKTSKTYTVNELNEIFKLVRAGETFIQTDTYLAGKTYKLVNGKYVLLESEEDVQYYIQAQLQDIFFVNYNNPNLEIEYKYGTNTLKQKINVKYTVYTGDFVNGETYYYQSSGKYVIADTKVSGITYFTKTQTMAIVFNGVEYSFVGTTYNFDDEQYDLKTGSIVGKTTEQIDSNVIRTSGNGEKIEEAYYCKQNALIFEREINGEKQILILSFDGSKKVYVVKANDISSSDLGSLDNLMLNYTQFGEIEENGMIKDYSTGYVSEIEYSIIPVFNIGDNNYCINTKDNYLIKVAPYVKSASMDTLIANTEYDLYGDGYLFEKDDNIKTFVFGAGSSDFSIINGSILKANSNGNKYTIKLPITITYSNGLTYLYNYEFAVVNEKTVGINYSFNITDKESTAYTLFNSKIDNLTNGMDGLAYDLTDLSEWLGYDANETNFEQETMKFDLVLKGDKINLADKNIFGVDRFETYSRVGKDATYDASATYYIYDINLQNYRIAEHNVDVDADKFKNYINYFTKTSAEIGDIELVVVSSTLANTLQNVKDNVVCRNGIITIGTDFNYTGYVAFKVYVKNSTAYGYYIAKIVDDDNFNNTIDSINSRYTQTISPELSGAKTIIDIIRTSGTDISSVGRFDNSLLASDNSNIYLFMIESYDNNGQEVKFDNGTGSFDISVGKSRLIENELKLKSTVNTQTVKVAVVINCNGSSLVYVCNYTINILSNVTVGITDNIAEIIDDAHNVYKAKSMSYDYDTNANNTKDLANFLTITGSGDVGLGSVELDTERTENKNIVSVGNDICYKFGEDELKFAEISGTNLKLTAGVSQTMEFYLKLTYNNDFVAYLLVIINPYQPKDANNTIELGQYDEGENKFVNSINVKEIFGNYSGEYTLHYSTDNVNFVEYVAGNGIVELSADGTLTITSTTKETVVYVKFTLKELVPAFTTSSYKLLCQATISNVWNGEEGNTARLKVASETDLSAMGSKLACEINSNSGITTLTIKNGGTEVLKINAKDFKSAIFTLTESGRDANKYFVGQDKISLDEGGDVGFIHLPKDIELTLLITIATNSGSYTGIGMIITLPKTYELETNYRTSLYEKLETKPENWDTNYTDYYYYIESSKNYEKNTSAEYKADQAYYVRTNANVETIVEDRLIDLYNYGTDKNIADTFFAKTETGNFTEISNNVYAVNTRRIHFVFNNGAVDYSDDAIQYVGILDSNNPNYLNIATVSNSVENGGENIINRTTLLVGKAGGTITLTMSNDFGVSFEYKFQVYTEESDLSKFEFEELLYVESGNYVSVSMNQLFDNNGNKNTSFSLGYLNYCPTNEDGNLGWVYTDNSNLSFNITKGTGTKSGSVSLASDKGSFTSGAVKVTIVTLNGISKQFTLNVNDINTVYGYDGDYEELYAGTEGYKLTDKASTGRERINSYNATFSVYESEIEPENWKTTYNNYYTYNSSTRKYVKNNFTEAPDFKSNTWYSITGTNIFGSDSGYTVKYVGAINGLVTYWPYSSTMDYGADDTSVVWYKGGAFGTRAVNLSMTLTLVFDVVKDSKVVTRFYYSISIKNDIRIGINRMLDEKQSLDLYLGSNIYTKESDLTTINLLESESDGNYNNIFVTLERFSTNNVIYDSDNKYVGKALYNGNENATLKTQSTYDFNNVSQYLKFSVSNISNGLAGRVEVDEDENGKLTISGNPSGSFTLNVFSTNGTGYGKSFDINVHPYYNVNARYNNSLNIGGGNYKSGDSVNLLYSGSSVASDYAFNVYQVGYGIKNNENAEIAKVMNIDDITMETKVFDIGTSFEAIKADTSGWSVGTGMIWTKATGENKCTYTLPAVPYSKSATEKQYYIVAVRLTVTHHGQSTTYFAHYRVYNTAYIEVNARYKDDKTVVFGDTTGCWTSGNQITLMDIGNKGMYLSLTPLTVEPSDWDTGYTNYYTYDEGRDVYNLIKTQQEFVTGKYYKLNDVVTLLNNGVTLSIVTSSGVENDVVPNVSGNKVTATLPNYLFTNSGSVKFRFKDSGGTILLEDTWIFKSNVEISPKSTKLLTDFFLQSEIGNQNYYDTEIVGIMSSWNPDTAKDFVNNATGATQGGSSLLTINSKFNLYKVTYSAAGNTVFTTTYEAYIIVGTNNLMQINFNGGNYYINYVVDDKSGNTVDIANYISIWSMENGKFTSSLVIPTVTSTNSKVSISGSKVTLNNIEQYTSGQSISISITSGVTRNVDLYFNIVITAKSLTEDGKMSNNSKLNEVIGSKTELTENDVENDIELKKTLLQLIRFNGLNLSENDIGKFKISIKKGASSYSIIYSYTDSSASYTRTLEMALS